MKKGLVTLLALLVLAITAIGQETGPSFLTKWQKAKTSAELKATAQKKVQLIKFTHQGEERYGVTLPEEKWTFEFQNLSGKELKELLGKPAYMLGGANFDKSVERPSMISMKMTAEEKKKFMGVRIRVVDQKTMEMKRSEYVIPISKAVKVTLGGSST